MYVWAIQSIGLMVPISVMSEGDQYRTAVDSTHSV